MKQKNANNNVENFLTGISQMQVHQEMSFSWNFSVDWYNFYRELCDEVIMKSSSKIGGPGKRVQIDESKFGKRKKNRGHGVEGQWVFGGNLIQLVNIHSNAII